MSERDAPVGARGSSQQKRRRAGRLLAAGFSVGAGAFAAAATLLLLLGTFWVWPISAVILGAAIKWSASAVNAWARRPVPTWKWTSWTVALTVSLGLAILGAVVPLRVAGVAQQAPWVVVYLCGFSFLAVLAAIFGVSRYVLVTDSGDPVRLG